MVMNSIFWVIHGLMIIMISQYSQYNTYLLCTLVVIQNHLKVITCVCVTIFFTTLFYFPDIKFFYYLLSHSFCTMIFYIINYKYDTIFISPLVITILCSNSNIVMMKSP